MVVMDHQGLEEAWEEGENLDPQPQEVLEVEEV
jgi:hypothetical protein